MVFHAAACRRMIFHSLVNQVESIEVESTLQIRKIYGSRARETQIALSLSRSTIEQRVLTLLSRQLTSDRQMVFVPRLIEQGSTLGTTYMQHIPGYALRELQWCDWPTPSSFSALGTFLAHVELLPISEIEHVFAGLEADRDQLREALLGFKLGYVPSVVAGRLALGDVGLKNIIFAERGLALIDFEFARIETPGYDVGQLSAELSVAEINKSVSKSYRYELVDAYANSGGDRAGALMWMDRLIPYYKKKI